MSEKTWLSERFEESRPHLRAVAYKMLGSVSDAEDAVQETWLRVSNIDVDGVDNLRGWLITVVGRVSLNMIRSRTTRREDPLEPQPAGATDSAHDAADPEYQAILGDSIALALQV